MVNRLGPVHQNLQKRLDMRGISQIITANDMRHALQRIVMGRRDMIGAGAVLARDDDIAMQARIGPPGFNIGLCFKLERELMIGRAQSRLTSRKREAPGENLSCFQPCLLFCMG